MESLAREALKYARNGKRLRLGNIQWNRFPDKFPNIMIEQMKDVPKWDIAFLASFDQVASIYEQWSVMRTIAEIGPRSMRIILPYFPTGTMERVDYEGQVATAKTLAKLLSTIPPAGPGNVPIYIWDIHALPIRHYFGDSIAPRFRSGMKRLKFQFKGKDPEQMAIAFPDAGALKRFHRMFEDETGKHLFHFIVCQKIRGEGEKRNVTIAEGNPAGKEVVIVDDLIHSGGTIIECLHALKKAGAKTVSAYATHAVMENEAWKKFEHAGFERVWLSNTCPETVQAVKGREPFRIISIAQTLANAIFEGLSP